MINEQMEKHIQQLVEENALVFETKEEYLTWRYAWKEKYKYISLLLKRAKNERKTKYYKKELLFTDSDKEYIKNNAKYSRWGIQETIRGLRWIAKNMICELYASRIIHKNNKNWLTLQENVVN